MSYQFKDTSTKYMGKWKQKCKDQNLCQSSSKKVHDNTGLLQKQEKSQINNLVLYLKKLEKEEQKSPKLTEEMKK